MKTAKHHLIENWKIGKCLCGINFQKDSIRIAQLDDNKWYNDYGDLLNTSNWNELFCMSCLKLHEKDLIEEFKTQSFLIEFNLALPNSNRLRKKAKATAKRNRIGKAKSIPTNKPIESKPTNKPIESKQPAKVNSFPKTDKGKARAEKKTNPIPTESKCRIISKPDKPIELTKEMEVKKPLIDLSNGPVVIEPKEVIENVKPDDNWSIGDPIDNETFELVIGSDWKLIRHDKQLDQWQFQSKQVVKGIPKWIADGEWIDYKEASELVIEGYCE
jgi:hypothetical protein